MRCSGSQLQQTRKLQRKWRQVRKALQITVGILKKHTLLILRERANERPLAIFQPPPHIQTPDLGKAHEFSTSSILVGITCGGRVSASKRRRSSRLCQSSRNWRSEICPVVSNFLMVGAKTVLRSAS